MVPIYNLRPYLSQSAPAGLNHPGSNLACTRQAEETNLALSLLAQRLCRFWAKVPHVTCGVVQAPPATNCLWRRMSLSQHIWLGGFQWKVINEKAFCNHSQCSVKVWLDYLSLSEDILKNPRIFIQTIFFFLYWNLYFWKLNIVV